MARKWAMDYINELLASDDYMALVDLSQCLCCCPQFRSDHAEYALPRVAFVFVEGLLWVAQSIRSGASAYFESTSLDRQLAMKSALQALAPSAFSEWYGRGMAAVVDELDMNVVDDWLDKNETEFVTWLRKHVREHQALVWQLTA